MLMAYLLIFCLNSRVRYTTELAKQNSTPSNLPMNLFVAREGPKPG